MLESFNNKISFFLDSSLFTEISKSFNKFNMTLFFELFSSLFCDSVNSFINNLYILFTKFSLSLSFSFSFIKISLFSELGSTFIDIVSTNLFNSLYKSKNSTWGVNTSIFSSFSSVSN